MKPPSLQILIVAPYRLDAEGDLSGVEIELTLDEDETGEEDEDSNASTENGGTQARSRDPPEPTRIQGEPNFRNSQPSVANSFPWQSRHRSCNC